MQFSAEAWRLVVDTALDAVVVMDRDGCIVDWNHNATAAFGWSREEVLGRSMADFIIPPRFREAHARGLRRFLDTGEAMVLGRRIEIWGLRRTGEEFPVELSISSVKSGDELTFVGFLRDISERRAAERLRERHALKTDALYRTIAFAAGDHSFEDALRVCLDATQTLTGWPLGHVFLPSKSQPVQLRSFLWHSARPEDFKNFRAATEAKSFAPGEGLPGRVWQSRRPEWIADVHSHVDFPRAHWPGGVEVVSALAFPIVSADRVVAVVEFFIDAAVQPDGELLQTLAAMGQQVGRVFERRHAEQSLREHAAALETEIRERILAEERQNLLLAELNHRVKNMLAVVMAIAAQTSRTSTSLNQFNADFLARLQALSSSHSLLTARNWQPVSILDLATEILAPHRREQIQLGGEPIWLPPKAVLSVGLILHELATNAIKYGALSVDRGKVVLRWRSLDRADGWVHMSWSESVVGPLAPPSREGFGSAMIRACVQHDLKGMVALSYGSDGLHCDFEFPLRSPIK